ncbi:putative F-box protein At1g67623 [Lotus japonicus]|uniref:putative F-box protein At1g67623 n=1 Tax=Lotus japonicus TaxID=34305 RepID=UPI0025840694|nr:putative F-box protein At1g67623 [Lotus japonicus]
MTGSRVMKKAKAKLNITTMTGSRIKKKAKNKRRHTPNNESHSSSAAIKSLPRDLLVEVIANVASHSFIDLHNLKKCSKDFLNATEDNYVWQQVSLETFPFIEWYPMEKKSSFLERCRKSGNIESLYREGLREYFNHDPSGNINHGLEFLKVATQKGHKEAKYVYGMILLCSKDDDLRKQGLEHMRFLRKSKCVISCRKKVQRFLRSMWTNNSMVEHNLSTLCNCKSTCNGWRVKRGRWFLLDDDDDDYDTSLCEYCRWDHEIKYFYNRLLNAY